MSGYEVEVDLLNTLIGAEGIGVVGVEVDVTSSIGAAISVESPNVEIGVPGSPGVDGQPGASLLSGHGAPAATIGKVGDHYLNLDTSELYGPKSAGVANATHSLTHNAPVATGADPNSMIVGADPLRDGNDDTYARSALTQGDGRVGWVTMPLDALPELTLANFRSLDVTIRTKGTRANGATAPLRIDMGFLDDGLNTDISRFYDPAIFAAFVISATPTDIGFNHTMLYGNSGTKADGVSDLIPYLKSGNCTFAFYVLSNIGDPNGASYTADLMQMDMTITYQSVWGTPVSLQGQNGMPGITIVHHGTDGAVNRPVGAVVTYWLGTATPTKAVPYDFWLRENV